MRRFVSLLLLPMAMLLIVPAHATPPSLVTGTATVIGGGPRTSFRTADDNAFVTSNITVAFTGGILGQATGPRTIKFLNATGVPHGEFIGTIVFTGTVMGGATGSMDISFVVSFIVTATGTSAEGQLHLGDGTGGLAGIIGEGTYTGNSGTGAVSLEVHFDPA